MDKDQTRDAVWAALFHDDNNKERPVTVVVHPVRPGEYLLSVANGKSTVPVFAHKIPGGTDTSVQLNGGVSHKLIIVVTSTEGHSDVLHMGRCLR